MPNGCPCLPSFGINPRVCYGTDNVRRLIYDCPCGQKDMILEPEVPQNTKENASDALHRGGPLAESLSVSSSHRVMTSNLYGG